MKVPFNVPPAERRRYASFPVVKSLLTVAVAVSLSAPVARADSTAQDGDTLRFDVESAIQRALEASPEVAAVVARRQSAEARSNLARASRFATDFSVTTAHAPSPGIRNPNDTPTDRLYLDPDVRNDWDNIGMFNRVEVELLQPIHTWGELSGNIRAAARAVDVERAAERSQALKVAARTAELYYGLLLAEALGRVATDASEVVDDAKKEINQQLQDGSPDVDDADLFQVLITEQEIRRRVIEVEERTKTARAGLRRQLFLPDDAVVQAADEFLEPIVPEILTLEEYLAISIENRPELEQASAGLAARDALIGVAKSNYFPKLFLGGRFKASTAPDRFRQRNPYHSDPLLGTGFEAGLGVRLGLNFLQTKARVEQARAQRNEVRHQLEGVRQLIQFEVEDAYRKLTIAAGALEATQEALHLSKEWLQTETVNFDLDLGDTENLVKAVRANLELRADEAQAIYEYNVAVIRLLTTCGLLVHQAESGTLVE